MKTQVYKFNDLFKKILKEDGEETPTIDNPEFYDVETKTLKLGNLCRNEIERGVNGDIEWNQGKYTTYCALLQLSNSIPKNIQDDLHIGIDSIYSFLRKDLGIDNRRKFHDLIKIIFKYDNPANTIKLISIYIDDTENSDEIKKTLDLFRKQNVNESEIDEFLRKAKFSAHKMYENSFVGNHFDPKEYKLRLKFRNEQDNRSMYSFIKDVLGGKSTIEEAVNYLYESILNNYSEDDMVKGDLVCIKPLYDQYGNLIIGNGEVVEVKKLDHAGDSYLSEFFAIYKYSKIPDDAKEKNFVKLYNRIIDDLFILFDKYQKSILKNISDNFAGIIYDNNIFVPSEYVHLYWSNKGRGSCYEDHRLSIRYRIELPSVGAYVYEKNNDILISKKLNIQLDKEKVFCPILTPKKVSESKFISNVDKLLFEGRKEDARTKYPNVPESDFNYFVENDPSGNQKYLEWLLKYYFQVNPSILVEYIKFFHQNQNMFIEKDINRHTPNSLDREIDDVREKIYQKQKKKQAKKESLRLYEDDRWLVISPKSWEASCYYGAGTKWCITMKDNPSYWRRYSKNASFFFIMDKTKKQDDPLYKVAYRKIGRRGKYELWNAPDYEISKSDVGQEYFAELPEELKNRIDAQHSVNFPPTEGREEWIELDPRAQALINGLNTDIIEDIDDYHYGMKIYLVDGDEHYVVGDNEEMDYALSNYYDDYSDEDLMEYYDYEGYYLRMDDEDGFIDDEVRSYLDNTSDREKIEEAGLSDKERDLEAEIEEFESRLESEEDEEEIENLESLIRQSKRNLNDLLEEAEEILADSYRSEWERCLSDGPMDCLVHDRGWFSNARELYRSGLVYIERTELIDSLVGNSDWDIIAPYGYDEFRDDEDGNWYAFRIDY